jgi:hypothetical protein
LLHAQLKVYQLSLLFLEEVQEEIATLESRHGVRRIVGLGVAARRCIDDTLNFQSIDVLDSIAWVEWVQDFLAFLRRGGEKQAVLDNLLLQTATDEGLD